MVLAIPILSTHSFDAAPPAMHIPDGFLSTLVAIILWIISAAFIGIALFQSRRQLGEKTIPFMGVLAAFIFAAQAINFPVTGGTSGHLVGAALAGILVGPWPAVLVMTAVLAIQGLLFQDGGILAMGGNILNMAVLGALLGSTVYRAVYSLLGKTTGARLAGSFFAAWVAVVASSIAASFELAASGTSPIGVVLPAMTLIHMLIGVFEGLITLGAVGLISRVRPDIMEAGSHPVGANAAIFIAAGLVISLIVALFSPLASPLPDGLDSVAEELAFAERAQEPLFNIFPDYGLPFINNATLSTMLAVAIGTIIVFVIALGLGRTLGRQTETVSS